MFLLGLDIGSSSIKAALVKMGDNRQSFLVQSPETEMEIAAPRPGWAEQHPETWWHHTCLAIRKLLKKSGAAPSEIKAIGIAYQMHGLVVVDENDEPLRPSIIWCDSRAVEIGERAFREMGEEKCLSRLLNSPGNFTASKLAWVKKNEPALFSKIKKMMLPGDYIAMRLTGEILTTPSGLSEGMLWDFQKNEVADFVLDHFGFPHSVVPEVVGTFSRQGKLSAKAAEMTGLKMGTPVTYRAGDQPNNALSLNVLNPGEVAATGGTSGVVYGVVSEPKYDPLSRVNGFAHVNHRSGVDSLQSAVDSPQLTVGSPQSGDRRDRIGILLCINGAGSQYAWVKKQVAGSGISYPQMEGMAAQIPVGSDGLRILPFGNGAERILGNRDPGAQIIGLNFNRHGQPHIFRAALEGIAFSFIYGMGILQKMGLNVQVMRVGNDNLFQSKIFSQTISNLIGSQIEMVETTGAIGAAKAAGVAIGVFASVEEAMKGGNLMKIYEPENMVGEYEEAYGKWLGDLGA